MADSTVFLFLVAYFTGAVMVLLDNLFLILDNCIDEKILLKLEQDFCEQITLDSKIAEQLRQYYNLPLGELQLLEFEAAQSKLNPFFQLLKRAAKEQGQDDVYLFFIGVLREYIKTHPYNKDFPTEEHHIIPKHTKLPAVYDRNNLICLSVGHHALAHWVRWKQYGVSGDLSAYRLKIRQQTDVMAERRKLAQEKMQRKKKGFYDPALQSILGKKGGAKGGSAGTSSQYESRRKVGQTYGRATGMGNASAELKQFLQKFSFWKFVGYFDVEGNACSYGRSVPDSRAVEIYILIGPKEAFIDVREVFCSFLPSMSTKYNHLYELAVPNRKSARKSRDGCTLVRTLTRSEVEAGALNDLPAFYTLEDLSAYNVNPDKILSQD